MISKKEAKDFLSKNSYYEVTNKDAESFQKILSKAPKSLEKGDLIGNLAYINSGDYFSLEKDYNYHIGFDDPFIFIDPTHKEFRDSESLNDNSFIYPDFLFDLRTVKGAIDNDYIIPTIFYLTKYQTKELKKCKKDNEDCYIIVKYKSFLTSFGETIKITKKIKKRYKI